MLMSTFAVVILETFPALAAITVKLNKGPSSSKSNMSSREIIAVVAVILSIRNFSDRKVFNKEKKISLFSIASSMSLAVRKDRSTSLKRHVGPIPLV